MPNGSYADVSPPSGLVGRQQFQKQFLISCVVERTKLKLVRPSTSLIGEMKRLEQILNKKVFVFEAEVCVCARFSHKLTHSPFHFFDDGKGHVCSAYPGFPDSSATEERLRQSKERDEQREKNNWWRN